MEEKNELDKLIVLDKNYRTCISRYLYVYSFVMKKIWFNIGEILWNFIYNNRLFYKKRPAIEEDLKKESLNNLIFLKETERDYLSSNVTIALGIFWVIFIFDDFLWKISFFILFLIALVNLTVAVEEKKENIKIYDKVINEKLKEQERKEEKYKKETIRYLKKIAGN